MPSSNAVRDLDQRFIPAAPAATVYAPPPTAVLPTWRRRSRWVRLLAASRPLSRRPGFLLAALVVAFALLAAVAPGALSGFDPNATAPLAKLTAPNATHWFGTDELGRDLYTRVIHGASLSIQAALLAVGLALLGGLTLGVLSGSPVAAWTR